MCGIAGVYYFKDHASVDQTIRRMTRRMLHRGPDSEGIFIQRTIGLGHRRLSIIDLSDFANQPFTDTSGRYVLVFNGEIYNFQEVKSQLTDYSFITNSDTEVLLAAFIKWGPGCLQYLRGMFAFAIWDNVQSSLFICRDRLGVKPLYFFMNDRVFAFASEIRALLASGEVERRLDRNALTDYFSFQSFTVTDSPIEGIRQLEAGTWMRWQHGKMETVRYWKPGSNLILPVGLTPTSVKADIRTLFRNAVESRLVSDVPIGAFLSGGIDSSAIVAMMSEVSRNTPVTFNLSFEEQRFDESAYARLLAEKYKTEHHEIRLSQQLLLTDLDEALSQLDIPSADGVNTFIVSRAIRKAGITVALSGVGGDELFAGYPFFKTIPSILRQSFLHNRSSRLLLASVLKCIPHRKIKRIAEMLSTSAFSVASLYSHFRRITTRQELSILTRLPDGDTHLEQQLFAWSNEIGALSQLSQISLCEYLGYTQQTLLKDTDQMSMAVALEVREPFFDHELIDYVLNVPDAIKKPVYPKSLLVESLKPMLPDEIVFRKKQGFLFPWEMWMKNELSGFCDRYIQRIAERDFINGPELIKQWKRFLNGDASLNWTQLWTFVVLEYWMEKNEVE